MLAHDQGRRRVDDLEQDEGDDADEQQAGSVTEHLRQGRRGRQGGRRQNQRQQRQQVARSLARERQHQVVPRVLGSDREGEEELLDHATGAQEQPEEPRHDGEPVSPHGDIRDRSSGGAAPLRQYEIGHEVQSLQPHQKGEGRDDLAKASRQPLLQLPGAGRHGLPIRRVGRLPADPRAQAKMQEPDAPDRDGDENQCRCGNHPVTVAAALAAHHPVKSGARRLAAPERLRTMQ